MYTIHEGEIVIKEKYGSSQNEILYVKPPDQSNIVILNNNRLSDVANWFTRIFLPQGYPDSVSKDYLAYQIWDTAQAFCSTITGTLATQEVLRGVGVGDTSATPLAATATWVIKDGCGHMGRIMFAFSHGTYLDAYSKKWRLYADTLNDAAMCIEIALPLFKNYTTFALCVSTIMKAIVGVAVKRSTNRQPIFREVCLMTVNYTQCLILLFTLLDTTIHVIIIIICPIGGATRAAMTQHHALRGNMADVSAKDSAQETAVNLVASFAALFIITVFGNSLTLFLFMIVLHIVFNYFAVRAVCLRTLNEPRFLQVIDMYLRKEIISTPCEINRKEPIIFYHLGPNLLDVKLCGFKIKLGCSIEQLVDRYPKALFYQNVKQVYRAQKYILLPNINKRTMYVVLKEEANTDNILCAYFHAVLLSTITCAVNDYPLQSYKNDGIPRPFAQVCQTLQSTEWSRELSENPDSLRGFLYEPTHDLILYVDKIVQREWHRVRGALLATGWDLTKHLLMVDEWRMCSKKLISEQLPSEIFHFKPIVDVAKIMPFGDVIEEMKSNESIFKNAFTIEPDVSTIRILEPSKQSVQFNQTKKDTNNDILSDKKDG